MKNLTVLAVDLAAVAVTAIAVWSLFNRPQWTPTAGLLVAAALLWLAWRLS